MSQEPVPTPRELIERYFVISEPPSPELIAAIDHFIKEELGITIFFYRGQWGGSEKWDFITAQNGQSIEETSPVPEFKIRKTRKRYKLAISQQGPFVTAESYSVVKEEKWTPPENSSFHLDEPTDPRAVAWAQAIAQRFNLHYVDAPSLRNWEVDRDALPDKGSFLDSSEPTAFNILFYEY